MAVGLFKGPTREFSNQKLENQNAKYDCIYQKARKPKYKKVEAKLVQEGLGISGKFLESTNIYALPGI